MESNNKLKELSNKNLTCYYFNDVFKFKDFDTDNVLIDEKPNGNILNSNISYKTLMVLNLCILGSRK